MQKGCCYLLIILVAIRYADSVKVSYLGILGGQLKDSASRKYSELTARARISEYAKLRYGDKLLV